MENNDKMEASALEVDILFEDKIASDPALDACCCCSTSCCCTASVSVASEEEA